jgi:hypothetical protein
MACKPFYSMAKHRLSGEQTVLLRYSAAEPFSFARGDNQSRDTVVIQKTPVRPELVEGGCL